MSDLKEIQECLLKIKELFVPLDEVSRVTVTALLSLDNWPPGLSDDESYCEEHRLILNQWFKEGRNPNIEWINIKERLPDPCQIVLAYGDEVGSDFTSRIAIIEYGNPAYEPGCCVLLTSGCGCCDDGQNNVTHWMPLPAPPET